MTPVRRAARRSRWPGRRSRGLLAWLLRLRGSPRAIARGVAIGTLVAFTPSVGLQTLLAVGLATLCNANRPAAALLIWITNPLTMAPVYAFTYGVGGLIWPGPSRASVAAAVRGAAREIAALDVFALRDSLAVFLALGFDVLAPMLIGGVLVGGVAAAIAYPLTLATLARLRRRRPARRRPRPACPPAPEALPVSRGRSDMDLAAPGEFVHVIERRLFQGDVRRHFIGTIEACTASALRVRGYLHVYDSGSNRFLRKPELRIRLIPLDNRVIINVLPAETRVDAVEYHHDAEGNLSITDRVSLELDISEFGASE